MIPEPIQDVRSSTTRSSPDGAIRHSEQKVVNPMESELCLQWYQPTMDEHIVTVLAEEGDEPDQPTKKDRQAMLLYAQWNRKTERQSCRMMWVSLSQLVELHDR